MATFYIDAINGNDLNTGGAGDPFQTIARAQSTWVQGNRYYLLPGSYGAVSIELAGDNTLWTQWIGSDKANPPQVDSIGVTCAQDEPCDGYHYFEGFDVVYPESATRSNASAVRIVGSNYLYFRKNRIRSVAGYLYNVAAGAQVERKPSNTEVVHHVTFENNDISNIIAAIRLRGENHEVLQNAIHRFPGTGIGSLSGAAAPGLNWSTRQIRVCGNHIFDHKGDYPEEAFWDFYDEPAELHASVVAMRGPEWNISCNEIHDIQDSVGLQTYDPEGGIIYPYYGLIIHGNYFYDMDNPVLSNTAPMQGSIAVTYNTIMGGKESPGWPDGDTHICSRWRNEDLGNFSKAIFTIQFDELLTNGAGSNISNNVIAGDFGLVLGGDYTEYAFPIENNFIYRTTVGYNYAGGGISGVPLSHDDYNIDLCHETFEAHVDWFTPSYSPVVTHYQHGVNCSPGSIECDPRPLAGSVVCLRMTELGQTVGAFGCQ